MIPYLLVLGFVILWVVLERKSLNRKAFWIPLTTLSLFAGLRSYQVGTDSGTYTRLFRSNLNIYNFEFQENVELGYQLLEYMLLRMNADYFWLFFLSSIIIVYCYLTIIKRYSVNYTFSVFLFITLGVYTFFFNGLRQGIAMAVFTIALPFLIEKRLIIYLIICFVGSLFHISALFMIPFYFIVNLRVKPIYKILATFLGSLLTSRLAVSYVAGTNERYEGYAQVTESTGGHLTLGFQTMLVLFVYSFIYIYRIKNKQFLKIFTFYASGVLFVIPLALLGTNPSGPQRLLSYFTWTLVLILPFVFRKINNSYATAGTVILCLIYFVLTTSKFSNLSPYILNPAFRIF